MDIRKKILLFTFIFICLFADGQSKINSTVEVKREFEGRLIESVKSPLDTRYSDTLLRFNLDFDYSTFDRPYTDLYEFSPMNPAHLSDDGTPLYPWLYVMAGVSYPWTPEADVYIAPRLGDAYSLLFYYNHNSFWGDLRFDESIKGDRMVNKAGVENIFRWKKGELKFGLGYSNNYYTYYGYDYERLRETPNVDSHAFNRLSAYLRVRSTNPDPSSFYYNIGVKYDYLDDKPQIGALTEHVIDADLELGATIHRYHKVVIGLVSSTDIFDNTSNFYSGQKGYLEIAPMYRWEKDRWRIKAGLSFGFPYVSSDFDKPSIATIHPNASASFEAVRNAFWLYAKVDGKNDLNTYSSLFSTNPWLTIGDTTSYTYSPLNIELGLRGTAKDRFSYELFGSYSMVRDMPVFLSDGSNGTQTVSFQDNNVLTVGAGMEWKTRDFIGGAEFRYRYYSDEDQAVMLPSVEAKLMAEYNFRKRIFFKLNCKFINSTFGYDISSPGLKSDVPGFVDLGLTITYAFNASFSFFAQCNNLTNSRIQYFLNYLGPGIDFGLGMCLKL